MKLLAARMLLLVICMSVSNGVIVIARTLNGVAVVMPSFGNDQIDDLPASVGVRCGVYVA